MAYHFCLACFYLFMLAKNSPVFCQLLSMGKDFAFALPKLSPETDSRITAYVYTSVKKDIKVTITTEGFIKGDNLEDEVTVNPGQSVPYIFPSQYYYTEGTNLKWAYRLRSTEIFGVTVVVLESPTSVATFLAIPLGSWGKFYYAVTLGYNPFIQIIAGWEMTLVRVRLFISAEMQKPNLIIAYQSKVFENLTVINVPLQSFQAYEISDCRKDNSIGSLSGSSITSQKPVGVLSGSCSSNSVSACLGSNKATDLTIEMLLPRETFGKEFVTPSMTDKYEPATYTFIPNRNSAVVQYLNPRKSSLQQIPLGLAGEPQTQNVAQAYAWMKSTEAVQIFYSNQSACTPQTTESLGVITLVFLLPFHLYYYNYIIVVPAVLNAQHFVFITLKRIAIQHMTLDGQKLTNPFFIIYKDLDAGSFLVSEGYHEIANVKNLPFGCHLLGYGPGFAYSHPAGLKALHINQDCDQLLEEMLPGDQIDNDCDGLVDEEFEDEQDNDNDQAIDEDLAADDALDNSTGNYLEWEDWHCTENCSDPRLMRTRKCVHPNKRKKDFICEGVAVEYTTGICYYNDTSCPDECPDFTWGAGCKLSCSNCQKPCNKFFGTCPQCNPGFKDPHKGCRYPCDPYTYGINCTESCEEKCGVDCWERVTGDCPTSQLSVLIIMTFVLLLPCINLLCTDKNKFDP